MTSFDESFVCYLQDKSSNFYIKYENEVKFKFAINKIIWNEITIE